MVTPAVAVVRVAVAEATFFDGLRHGFVSVTVILIGSPGSMEPLLLPRLSSTATFWASSAGAVNDSTIPWCEATGGGFLRDGYKLITVIVSFL